MSKNYATVVVRPSKLPVDSGFIDKVGNDYVLNNPEIFSRVGGSGSNVLAFVPEYGSNVKYDHQPVVETEIGITPMFGDMGDDMEAIRVADISDLDTQESYVVSGTKNNPITLGTIFVQVERNENGQEARLSDGRAVISKDENGQPKIGCLAITWNPELFPVEDGYVGGWEASGGGGKVHVRNADDQTIPAYSPMEIVGFDSTATTPVVDVKIPSANNIPAAVILANGDNELEVGKTGWGYQSFDRDAKFEVWSAVEGDLKINAPLGTKANDTKLYAGSSYYGFIQVSDTDKYLEGCFRARCRPFRKGTTGYINIPIISASGYFNLKYDKCLYPENIEGVPGGKYWNHQPLTLTGITDDGVKGEDRNWDYFMKNWQDRNGSRGVREWFRWAVMQIPWEKASRPRLGQRWYEGSNGEPGPIKVKEYTSDTTNPGAPVAGAIPLDYNDEPMFKHYVATDRFGDDFMKKLLDAIDLEIDCMYRQMSPLAMWPERLVIKLFHYMDDKAQSGIPRMNQVEVGSDGNDQIVYANMESPTVDDPLNERQKLLDSSGIKQSMAAIAATILAHLKDHPSPYVRGCCKNVSVDIVSYPNVAPITTNLTTDIDHIWKSYGDKWHGGGLQQFDDYLLTDFDYKQDDLPRFKKGYILYQPTWLNEFDPSNLPDGYDWDMYWHTYECWNPYAYYDVSLYDWPHDMSGWGDWQRLGFPNTPRWVNGESEEPWKKMWNVADVYADWPGK